MSDLEPVPRVLFVGGLDSSGAAGLLADVKTAQELGCFACAATTAVTAQNRAGVADIMPIPASLVGAQMDAAWTDAPVEVVKTGMLVNADIVLGVAARLSTWGSSTRLIVDPVLKSSTGRTLLDEDGRGVLVDTLIPRPALLTPNLLEAEQLTGLMIERPEQMDALADRFLAMGAQAVLIKGGHFLDRDPGLVEVFDLLRTLDGEQWRITRPRVHASGSRGTGCALASAIAAHLAEGLTLRTAVESARDFVQRALEGSAVHGAVQALHHAAHREPSPSWSKRR